MNFIKQLLTFLKRIIRKLISIYFNLMALISNNEYLTVSNLGELLHALRGRELRNIPAGAKAFLSAGCAGRWYFDWINENYPGITRHLGVEAYSPKPEDLPDEVVWLPDYIYDMKSVADNDVDLVFAGQTVEHLWPHEMAGFLTEAYRVLKEDGLLVLDSPNQPVGKELDWYHPQHTMEFSVKEIVELVTLAGFVDVRVKGIWLCYDRRRKKYLRFEPLIKQINLDTNKRVTNAKDRPEDSFIWWLEARKSTSIKPDEEKVISISERIYDREYARNLSRVFTQVGKFVTLDNNRFIQSKSNKVGVLRHGPYIPLVPGNYAARFQIGIPRNLPRKTLDKNSIALQLKVTAVNFSDALAEKTLHIKDLGMMSNLSGNDNNLSVYDIEFSIPEVAFGVEFLAITFGYAPIIMKADFELVKLDDPDETDVATDEALNREEDIPGIILEGEGETAAERLLSSSACSQKSLESKQFQTWVERMKGRSMWMHRKLWEWSYISQALYERGLLKLGIRGLGFAVGQEPLPALFASYGCEILATDMATEEASDKDWVDTNQHAAGLHELNKAQICPDGLFNELVSFRFVDMNQINDDLRGFDFIWSSCSLEHLGSLEHGKQFIYNAMACLKPGGFAVHTTEFNISSNEDTIEKGPDVIYRIRDFEEIKDQLGADGHIIDLDFSLGNKPFDLEVDIPPYKQDVHLRLEIGGYTCTSYGLIIQKKPES